MKIITAGPTYMDIDAYAGCIAYAELLNLQGTPAIAFSSAILNESVTATIRSWRVQFSTNYTPDTHDVFGLVDVSNPNSLDKYVILDQVEEVIDHHLEFQEYWKNKIGDKASVEFVGAACTMVYEKWREASLQDQISVTSARLLMSGILDNTLNFKATITTNRDRRAYNELCKRADLPKDYPIQYFDECQASILDDVAHAIINDTKIQAQGFKNLSTKNIAMGQLVMWDGREVLGKHQATIYKTMRGQSSKWFMNLVSISEDKSYFICDNDTIKDWMERVLGVTFIGAVAESDRLWLRKEIVKQDMLYHV